MFDKKKVILVVEDEKSTQKMYRVALEHMGGFFVYVASTIFEAKKIFISNKEIIDVIIMDGQLPDGESMGLVVEIKKICPKIKIIAASGLINENLMKAGCDIDMPKPVSIPDLINTIKKI